MQILMKEVNTHTYCHNTHPVATLIIINEYEVAQLGYELVIGIIRRSLIKVRRKVNCVSRNCLVCKTKFACVEHQRMADLPSGR